MRTDPDDPEWRCGLIGGAPPAAVPIHGDGWDERHWSSRRSTGLGEASAHATASLVAAAAVLAWLAVGVATDFPDWWETVLCSTGASVTW